MAIMTRKSCSETSVEQLSWWGSYLQAMHTSQQKKNRNENIRPACEFLQRLKTNHLDCFVSTKHVHLQNVQPFTKLRLQIMISMALNHVLYIYTRSQLCLHPLFSYAFCIAGIESSLTRLRKWTKRIRAGCNWHFWIHRRNVRLSTTKVLV